MRRAPPSSPCSCGDRHCRMTRRMSPGKALVALVGKHVVHVAGLDALLVALPERGIEQVGMVFHEHFAHRRVAEQEGLESLGEYILGADCVPDLAGHLLLVVM